MNNCSVPKRFNLLITGIDREFNFKASDEKTAEKWIEALKFHITDSEGFRYQKTIPKGVSSKPWKFDSITERQFINLADTGDILLFKGNNFSGGLQRTVFKS